MQTPYRTRCTVSEAFSWRVYITSSLAPPLYLPVRHRAYKGNALNRVAIDYVHRAGLHLPAGKGGVSSKAARASNDTCPDSSTVNGRPSIDMDLVRGKDLP